jgi:hypothetical protein
MAHPGAIGLPIVPTAGCSGLLGPLCHAAGAIGTTVVDSGANSLLSDVVGWVVSGADWLLGQIGSALSATTSVDLGAGWFASHYAVMAALSGVVVLPLLLLSTIQAVYRQSASVLVRSVLVQLPLAALLAGAAVQLVQLSLAATDALSNTVAAGTGTNIEQALDGVAKLLAASVAGGPQSPPAFVVLLGGLLVAFGAFLLWIELLVRAAAVYVAVLFLPLALASLVWPSIAHWCRRLVDSLVALILAKFVIVAILSLAVAALASGTQDGFSSVLGGAALLLLAAFAPFTLLKLVPAVEAGAIAHLDGVRHRSQQAVVGAARTAASHALRAAGASTMEVGSPGTGLATAFEAPGEGGGGEDGGGGGGGGGGAGAGGGGAGVGAAHGDGGGGAGAADGDGGGGPGGSGSSGALAGPPSRVPMWRGVPPPAMPAGGDVEPARRGPLPLQAAPAASEQADSAPDAGISKRYAVRHDGLGPVLVFPPARSQED